MTTVDAHQHFWALARGDYGWLTPELVPLYRDFGPSDLAPLARAAGIERSVVVQAAPTVEETRYLLELARQAPSVAGVVGWVPLDEPGCPALIAELARAPKFKGVRPMLQDLPEDDWIATRPLDAAIEALIEHGLVFDALVFARHLPFLQTFAERHPRLRIVVDHGAKPAIRDAEAGWHPWAERIAALARLPQIYCKLSGLVTEASAEWDDETLAPYVAHLLEHFGPRRLMWGSDWPVVDLRGGYDAWHSSAQRLTQALAREDREAIFGGTASICYRL
ncbi:amidohydrolase family protein [Trinickia caryophylli]|uniref:L-fuconolactonase n=1 Tax=Trinickia caryophylli TaxID=28094 RepID=A0A1X7H4T6_TRICW|nr:amidohydrolase family protein [Trinickia caryophylli]PMS09606.1 amidohydrolase [Trinickia caryophylli]TRX17256.1 amidohydrolase family protein [Trinickia caryophylli]WQE12007.1 amidohydrolase family protein [Trinickia caryophylli]SMF79761.1 L-fuconolactonase [Trinickia caryophylli]GLU35600.1 hydrolase [Trinickia caryophylli]